MKKETWLFILLVICGTLLSSNQTFAQKSRYVAGVEYSYLSPIGTMADRWKPASAGSFHFGVRTSNNWIWSGRFEYFSFTKVTQSKTDYYFDATIKDTVRTFLVPLSRPHQSLKAAGLLVNAEYLLVKSEYFNANVNFGFGIYNWTYNRSEHDSLTLDTTVLGTKYHLLALGKIPANTQTDWSGTFTVGLEFAIPVYQPIELLLSANYKNIVGELWPALSYNMENVATMQMYDLRCGIRAKF